jgi:hypothetical protein
MILFNEVVSEKSQADGAFIVEISTGYDSLCHYQIEVEVNAVPSAGSLAVAIRSPGAREFVALDGSFDLTGAELLKTFGPCFVEEIKFTPTSFDSGKTYNVHIIAGEI